MPSLVGSEMCIRDRPSAVERPGSRPELRDRATPPVCAGPHLGLHFGDSSDSLWTLGSRDPHRPALMALPDNSCASRRTYSGGSCCTTCWVSRSTILATMRRLEASSVNTNSFFPPNTLLSLTTRATDAKDLRSVAVSWSGLDWVVVEEPGGPIAAMELTFMVYPQLHRRIRLQIPYRRRKHEVKPD